MNRTFLKYPVIIAAATVFCTACNNSGSNDAAVASETTAADTTKKPKPISEPLVTDIYTADPSAHVFEAKIYIYPSHDIDAGTPENDMGDHFDMRDYHIFSMDSIGAPVKDHGVALDIKDIPWAGRQLWAPDAAFANGKYYLYFPVKAKSDDAFRIGVATSASPAGPFKAEAEPIKGSYSIDPTVFKDTDGTHYMYFGGIWGGQLQRWSNGKYDSAGSKTDLQKDDQPAIGPRVAKMDKNMLQFAEPVKEIQILDKEKKPILGKDHDRRFFEAAWIHKYNNKYYFSYSTGDSHKIVYAIGNTPYGPFIFQGEILSPVVGWTTHHSIVEIDNKWYLFYHDSKPSGGHNNLRSIKVRELFYDKNGMIKPMNGKD